MSIVLYTVGCVLAGVGMVAFWGRGSLRIVDPRRASACISAGTLIVMATTWFNLPTAAPAVPLTPEQTLAANVRATLERRGATLKTWTVRKPGVARDTIEGEWVAPRGFTTVGVWGSVRDVLEMVTASGLANGGKVWIKVQLPAKDDYGQPTTVFGLNLLFDAATLNRVNWNGLDVLRMRRLASTVTINPRVDPD